MDILLITGDQGFLDRYYSKYWFLPIFLSYNINILQLLCARLQLLRLSDRLPQVIKTYFFLPLPSSLLIYIKTTSSCFKNKKCILLLFLRVLVWIYRWLWVSCSVGAGNWTSILCESCQCSSLLNHLSSSPSLAPYLSEPWLMSCRSFWIIKHWNDLSFFFFFENFWNLFLVRGLWNLTTYAELPTYVFIWHTCSFPVSFIG